jgi:hypothetical protein
MASVTEISRSHKPFDTAGASRGADGVKHGDGVAVRYLLKGELRAQVRWGDRLR